MQTLKPTIWVGKNGYTDDLLAEIRRQLETRKVIKIKWLQSSDMKTEEVQDLASSVSAEVIAARGRMVVLGAKNRGKVLEAGPARRTPPKNLSARDKIKSSFMGRK
ncbi:MAG: YhbY family RNA-binding protein [Methanocorpusculum parvum]|nr:YhbY family RNA-binding protein [Methanocorpusculum parvum]